MRSITPDEIEKFICEHCPQEDWRVPGKVRPWVNWMMSHGCMDAFTEDGSKISVVLCSRLTNTDSTDDGYAIDPEGDCVVVDLLLSTRDNILKSIANHLKNKYGVPPNIHWKRGTRHTTARAQRLEKRLIPN